MLEQNIIYFRADGNTKIGLGHIIRSMALADMLKEEFDCIFLTQNPSEILQKQIKENFGLIILPETEDYLQEAEFIKETYLKENDIIVLDGYNFQTEYQQIIKSLNHSITQSSIKLVCIDDMQDWHFVADAVINHAGGVKAEDYSCEAYTKLYLGTEYALLRKPFLEAAKKDRNIEKVEKVFICFGGSDIHNLSQKATEACLKSDKFTEVHVVLGSAYPFFEDFTNFAQEYKKIQIHQNLDAEEMCDLMQHCELAIVPASSIAYESIANKMLLFVKQTANNQKSFFDWLLSKNLAQVFNEDGFVFDSSLFATSKKVSLSRVDYNLIKIFNNMNLQTKKFESENLYLRIMGKNDISEDMLNWFKNDSLMKYYTNSKKAITKNDIVKSIEDGIITQTNYTFGIYYKENNEIIGTIKLGPINQVHRISDLVVLIGNTNYHGKGFSVEAIKLGNKVAFDEFDIRKLFGGMYANNIASIKAYTRAGWEIEGKLKGHYLENGEPMDRVLVGCFNPEYFS